MIYEESFPASNLLGREASPYLLQHAGNPVHWRSWGPDAFHEARVRDLPILLSVGYAACHWCHVMAHESFENPATAAVMNRLFVNVKVDREERPEVDQIYMAALHALGEQGGWPLTMFLTPEGAPFWGGTYFPPEPRYGRAGFVQVLEAVADAYRNRADAVHQNGSGLLSALAEPPRRATGELGPAFFAAAAKSLLGATDPVHGGLKGAPKFPNAAMLELLWRAGRAPAERASRDAVLTALERMANGGIYDHIGGGFARYSVDHRWLVPHFEKMLYDNAQLVGLLTIAYVDTGESGYRRRVEETVAWLLRDMLAEGGAFAASVDADSEGEEGLFYLWKPGEVDAALGYQDGAVFANAYDVSPQGNFEGRSIPNRLIAGFPTDSEEERLAPLRERMRAARALRSAPARDDKVLADWNGLAIAALADAGRVLGNDAWIAAAEHAFGRVIDLLGEGDRLGHSARAGKRVFPGLSTDYGAMIRAAIALAEATEDESFIGSARRWLAALDHHHWIEDRGAYALAADDTRDLPLRLSSALDEATPSGNALAAEANVRLWLLTGEDRYRARADRIFATFAGEAAVNAFGHAALLNAFDTRLDGLQVVVTTTRSAAAGEHDPLVAVVRRSVEPGRVVIHTDQMRLPPGHPAFGKGAVGGRTTVYLCRGTQCSLPITEPDALRRALR